MATFADSAVTFASTTVTFGLAPGAVIVPQPIAQARGTLAPTGSAVLGNKAGLRASGAPGVTGTALRGTKSRLNAAGTLSPTAHANVGYRAGFAASAALRPTGTAQVGRFAGLQAASSLSPTLTVRSLAAFNGLDNPGAVPAFATLTPTGEADLAATRPLRALASLTPTGVAKVGNKAVLSSPNALTPTGVALLGKRAGLQGRATLAPSAVARQGNRRTLSASGTLAATGQAYPTGGKPGEYNDPISTYANPSGTYRALLDQRPVDLRASAFLFPTGRAETSAINVFWGASASLTPDGLAFLGAIRRLAAIADLTPTGWVNPTPAPLNNQPGPLTVAWFTDGTPRMAFRLQRVTPRGYFAASSLLVPTGTAAMGDRRTLAASGSWSLLAGAFLGRSATLHASGHTVATGFANVAAKATLSPDLRAVASLTPTAFIRSITTKKAVRAVGTLAFASGFANVGNNSTKINTFVTMAAPGGITSLTFDPSI